jgi:hypothetical protein
MHSMREGQAVDHLHDFLGGHELKLVWVGEPKPWLGLNCSGVLLLFGPLVDLHFGARLHPEQFALSALAKADGALVVVPVAANVGVYGMPAGPVVE